MNPNNSKLNLSKRARGMAAYFNPKSESAEQFHMLHEAIELIDNKNEFSSLLITSATKGEGVSTTSANFAIVSAQTGKKVLLVDADFRMPGVHDIFNIELRNGFSDFLSNRCSLKQATIFSGITNLDLVISGHELVDHPSQLLHSSRMEQFLEEMKKAYDLIIFDTPPLLPYSDGQIIAQHVDGAVLVVRNRKTARQEAIKARERLLATNAKVLGVVYNYQMKNMKKLYK